MRTVGDSMAPSVGPTDAHRAITTYPTPPQIFIMRTLHRCSAAPPARRLAAHAAPAPPHAAPSPPTLPRRSCRRLRRTCKGMWACKRRDEGQQAAMQKQCVEGRARGVV